MAVKTFGAQQKQTLKAKGCPDDCVTKLEQSGCDPGDCAKLADVVPAGALNWQALLALVAQYGPQVIALILSLFNKQPQPTPTPPPAV